MSRPPEYAVVYDIQALQNPQHRDRGIGRYITDHVEALVNCGAPIAALVLNPDLDSPALPASWMSATAPDGQPLVRWNTPSVVRDLKVAGRQVVYHCGSPFEPVQPGGGVVPRHALLLADTLSATVFDVIPFRFPELHQPDHRRASLFRRRAQFIRCCDVVLAISQFTATDAIDALGLDPQRVQVQGTGGSATFPIVAAHTSIIHPLRTSRVAALVDGLRGSFILTVTGWGDARKNPTTTFAAYAALPAEIRDRYQLVVVCSLPEHGRVSWLTQLASLGITANQVIFTGHVDDATLRSLYQSTDLFVFSSRYEGFGLPVLEAARSGAACITSNTTSIPEILDFQDATFEPDDQAHLAQLMERALTDDSFQTKLRQAGVRAAQRHTWDAVAQRTLDAWSPQVTADAGTGQGGRKRRPVPLQHQIALVGPFPPSKSGIGTFNARVADALDASSVVRVDRFTEGDMLEAPRNAQRQYRQYPARALGTTITPGAYDTRIYTIGNGSYHRATLAAALRFPGVVWLHDAHLAGLFLTAEGLFLPGVEPGPAQLERARTNVARHIEAWHGVGSALSDDTWWRTDAYDTLAYTFLEPLVETAIAFIVNTDAARNILGRVASAAQLPIPAIHLLPLPYPAVDTRNNALTDPDLIVSLGWVDPLKRPDSLIEAVAEASMITRRRLRLAFVGELSPMLNESLTELATTCGILDRVTFTGFTTDTEYWNWLQRAGIVVQLRSATRGEASAALCDAIAAGRPIITSITTATELPSGVLCHVGATASPSKIAHAIAALVTDEAQRTQLGAAAKVHADSWTFDDLAERVIEIAVRHPRAQVGPPLLTSRHTTN